MGALREVDGSQDASGIHPTARVDAGAVLADDVSVGAYSIIGRMFRLVLAPA